MSLANRDWDYITVGGGSAGSTLACQAASRVLLQACRMTAEAIASGPGRRHGAQLYAPAGKMDVAGWLAFFRETAALNWHPASTCRMGPAPEDGAVVDATLAVHGLRGLSIADASIMPNVTSGNTNIPVIAIAERAAGFIAARHG
jgi:choline dehydrogenase